jgi:hypothetical protein
MGGAAGAVVEAELVHDPVGFEAVRGAALVEDERLAHADDGVELGVDGLVAARGLPEALRGGAVGAVARRVLAVLAAEEVVVRLLLVRVRLDLAQLCTPTIPMFTTHFFINIKSCIPPTPACFHMT